MRSLDCWLGVHDPVTRIRTEDGVVGRRVRVTLVCHRCGVSITSDSFLLAGEPGRLAS